MAYIICWQPLSSNGDCPSISGRVQLNDDTFLNQLSAKATLILAFGVGYVDIASFRRLFFDWRAANAACNARRAQDAIS